MVRKTIKTENNKITEPSFGNAVLSNDNRSFFSFSENKKTYTAENSCGKIGIRLQIDGNLYTATSTKKCDKGLLLDDGRFYLVELKGVDINTACEQLISTLTLLKNDYKDFDFNYYGRIVAKKGIPESNTSRQRAMKNFGIDKFLLRENSLTEEV